MLLIQILMIMMMIYYRSLLHHICCRHRLTIQTKLYYYSECGRTETMESDFSLCCGVWIDDKYRKSKLNNKRMPQLSGSSYRVHLYVGYLRNHLHTITANKPNQSHVDLFLLRCLFFSAELTFSKVFCCSFCTTFQYLSKLISPP